MPSHVAFFGRTWAFKGISGCATRDPVVAIYMVGWVSRLTSWGPFLGFFKRLELEKATATEVSKHRAWRCFGNPTTHFEPLYSRSLDRNQRESLKNRLDTRRPSRSFLVFSHTLGVQPVDREPCPAGATLTSLRTIAQFDVMSNWAKKRRNASLRPVSSNEATKPRCFDSL